MAGLPTPVQGMKLIEEFLENNEENARPIEVDPALIELCNSIAAQGLLQPVCAIDHGSYVKLFCGFRRVGAIRYGISQGLAVPKQIPVLLYPPTLTPSQIKILQLSENLQRADLTDPQIFRTCQALLELNPDWRLQDLARHLNKDASTVTRYTSPKSLVPEALEAFLAGKFGFAKAYAIAKLPEDQQGGLLAMTLSGATRDELERQGRKRRSAGTSAVRVPSIKVALANDISVVIKGESIDLEQGIEALKDALKAMTKARDTGLDAKTAQAVWRDVAKAG